MPSKRISTVHGRHSHCGGALIPAGNDFKNTAETRIIEKKCDNK
jgi:hypothetical protein